MTQILFLTGSLRAASSSAALTDALIDALPDGAEGAKAGIGALPHYNADIEDDPAVSAFVDAVGAADALVFVTPEYNYSIPGVLKNAIDWASRPAFESVFKGKPCLVVTVSGGPTGGVRAQSHLKYVLNGMLAVVHPGKEILVPFANKKVEDGRFTDTDILDFAKVQIDAMIADL